MACRHDGRAEHNVLHVHISYNLICKNLHVKGCVANTLKRRKKKVTVSSLDLWEAFLRWFVFYYTLKNCFLYLVL